MDAAIFSIAHKPLDTERRPEDRFSRVSVERVMLEAGHGIAGDAKSRPDSRQLNLMLAETIDQLSTEGFACLPGQLGEQIVIRGLTVDAVVPGTRLQLGETAVVELGYFRIPCGRFARIQRQSKDSARGRLGFMARVLMGGEIAVGSAVQIVAIPHEWPHRSAK